MAESVTELAGWVYQVKWDGVRMLAFINEGSVSLQNKGGRLKTAAFPELNYLGNIPGSAVLDGEVVVLHQGKPNFSMILRRNFALKPWPGAPPIAYVVFDLLYLEDKDLRPLPLESRQKLLSGLRLPPGPVSVIDNFHDGQGLYQLTGERGWEGIVAKDLSSSYIPGKNASWLKIKHRQRQNFQVVGYTTDLGRVAALLLGVDFGQGLVFAGAAASGLSEKGKRELQLLLPGLAAPGPALKASAKIKAAYWLQPYLQAEVEFMEWTDTGTIRSPVIKALRFGGKEIALS